MGNPRRGRLDLDDPLGGALDDAQVLLAFAAQGQRSVGEELLRPLIEASAALRAARQAAQVPGSDTLVAFWKAFDGLSAALAPTSAHSVRESMEVFKAHWWDAASARITVPGLLAFVVFVAAVMLIGYTTIGRALLERSEQLQQERAVLVAKAREQIDKARTQESRLSDLALRLGDAPECARPGAVARATPALAAADRSKLLAECAAGQAALADQRLASESLRRDLDARDDVARAQGRVLQTWYRACPPPVCRSDWIDEYQRNSDELRRQVDRLRPPGVVRGDLAPRAMRLPDEPERRWRDLSIEMRRLDSQFGAELNLRARNVLSGLSEHLIPLLMGVLGAFAFILRSLTLELRGYTHVRSSAGLAFIRVCLGAISGVFGVALLTDTDRGLVKGVSPLVVPFLFGYGIEIVFSVMDRVVHAFNGGEVKPAPR